MNDATQNPDGSLTPVNSPSDAAAYPMPSVIYAVVKTAPVSQSQATAESTLLTQLLDLTGGNDVGDLPQGFVPLPANLLALARADVTRDVNVAPLSSGGSGSAPGSDTTSSGDNGASSDQTGLLAGGAIDYLNAPFIGGVSPLVAAAVLGINAAAAHAGLDHLGALLGPALPGYALVASHGSAVEQVAFVFGLAALRWGRSSWAPVCRPGAASPSRPARWPAVERTGADPVTRSRPPPHDEFTSA